MALPQSGDTFTQAYIYSVPLDVAASDVLQATIATNVAAPTQATFGTDNATGQPTITYTDSNGNTVTTTMTDEGGDQSANAFTFKDAAGNSYIFSNQPITGSVATLSVEGLQVLLGGLGDIGLTPGAQDYVACYVSGTLILTSRGEVAVEDLVIGDRLVTAAGAARKLKWIGTRAYGGRFITPETMPVCIRRGALADGVPQRDLYVSPRHALFLDGALFPAGLLVNDSSIQPAPDMDVVHYFHLELESHDVILAEGAAAESFVDDNSRNIFYNARQYRALYPAAKTVPALYCAERIEDGYRLEAMIQRLAARGRLLRPDGTAPALSPVGGSLDRVHDSEIIGWARNADAPDERVELLVLDNGVVIDEIVADLFRPDLQAAGIGDGYHAFQVSIPGRLSALSSHIISVRRKLDGQDLPNSPMILAAAEAPRQAA